MKRFIKGQARDQSTRFREYLVDWVDEDNPVRVIHAFLDDLGHVAMGFAGVDPKETGWPSYHPGVHLKPFIYGYLSAVQSSCRLEREARRNVEVMWQLGRLVPHHKTIAELRRNNGPAIRRVCALFIGLCRRIGLVAHARPEAALSRCSNDSAPYFFVRSNTKLVIGIGASTFAPSLDASERSFRPNMPISGFPSV